MNALTDKKVFNIAFRELRKLGFVAKQNFSCCQGCAWSELSSLTPEPENVVFYHNQDYDAFDKQTKNLEHGIYLAWSGNGQQIVDVFTSHGYEVEWNGTENERILIKPKTA